MLKKFENTKYRKSYFSYKLTKRYKGIGLAVAICYEYSSHICISISYAQTPRQEVRGSRQEGRDFSPSTFPPAPHNSLTQELLPTDSGLFG